MCAFVLEQLLLYVSVADDWGLEYAKGLWETQRGFAEKGPNRVGVDSAVQSNHWRLEWNAVGVTWSGDYYCIDYAANNSGVKGQIIEFIHDDTSRRLWSDDISTIKLPRPLKRMHDHTYFANATNISSRHARAVYFTNVTTGVNPFLRRP